MLFNFYQSPSCVPFLFPKKTMPWDAIAKFAGRKCSMRERRWRRWSCCPETALPEQSPNLPEPGLGTQHFRVTSGVGSL